MVELGYALSSEEHTPNDLVRWCTVSGTAYASAFRPGDATGTWRRCRRCDNMWAWSCQVYREDPGVCQSRVRSCLRPSSWPGPGRFLPVLSTGNPAKVLL